MMFKRLCIYTKDIQIITGRSEKYARDYMRTMKDVLKKEPHQFVTIKEFCDYADMPREEVEKALNI